MSSLLLTQLYNKEKTKSLHSEDINNLSAHSHLRNIFLLAHQWHLACGLRWNCSCLYILIYLQQHDLVCIFSFLNAHRQSKRSISIEILIRLLGKEAAVAFCTTAISSVARSSGMVTTSFVSVAKTSSQRTRTTWYGKMQPPLWKWSFHNYSWHRFRDMQQTTHGCLCICMCMYEWFTSGEKYSLFHLVLKCTKVLFQI